MRNTFAEIMHSVGKVDEKLVVLVGDISHFALQDFAKACPGRFYNVGICEPTIVSMAAGLSHSGLHPVAHTITPFLIERSFEQIKLDFCYQELGGTLISVGSAFDYTGLGCSHFCYNDIAIIKSLPRTQIIYPAMPNEFEILFKETYANNFLSYFRLPKKKHGVEIADELIKFGKAVTIDEGNDISIIASGPQLSTAVAASKILKDKRIRAEIIYTPTIKPFDYETVTESIQKTGAYIVIEEHSSFGGVGDEVARCSADISHSKKCFMNLGNKFSHHYGTYEEHCDFFGLTVDNLIAKALAILS